MRATARTICLLLTLAAVAATMTACGGGDETTSTEEVASSVNVLPPNAPQTKVIAKQFPVPEPETEGDSAEAKAIAAGRKACKGKTPTQVRDEFEAAAAAEAGLNEGQEEMLAELDKFEKQARTSPDFAAGQLAAGVYEASLPESERMGGYRGCVYELAVQLRRELAKKG